MLNTYIVPVGLNNPRCCPCKQHLIMVLQLLLMSSTLASYCCCCSLLFVACCAGSTQCPPTPPGDVPANSLGFNNCPTSEGSTCRSECTQGPQAGSGYTATCVNRNGLFSWVISGACGLSEYQQIINICMQLVGGCVASCSICMYKLHPIIVCMYTHPSTMHVQAHACVILLYSRVLFFSAAESHNPSQESASIAETYHVYCAEVSGQSLLPLLSRSTDACCCCYHAATVCHL